MWIKTLDTGRHAWVNINHITHFEIELSNNTAIKPYDVVAYLDTETIGHNPRKGEIVEGQAFVTVKRGTEKQCKRFIKKKLCLQFISQWIGYLVAGGVGAVLTYLLGFTYLLGLLKS